VTHLHGTARHAYRTTPDTLARTTPDQLVFDVLPSISLSYYLCRRILCCPSKGPTSCSMAIVMHPYSPAKGPSSYIVTCWSGAWTTHQSILSTVSSFWKTAMPLLAHRGSALCRLFTVLRLVMYGFNILGPALVQAHLSKFAQRFHLFLGVSLTTADLHKVPKFSLAPCVFHINVNYLGEPFQKKRIVVRPGNGRMCEFLAAK